MFRPVCALAGDGWNVVGYVPAGFGGAGVPNGIPPVFNGGLAGELPNAMRIVSFRSSKALFGGACAGDEVAIFGGGGRPGGPALRGSFGPAPSSKNGLGIESSVAACNWK